MSTSYKRLLTIIPSPDCVFQDCTRILDSFEAVYNSKGVILDEHGTRTGGGVWLERATEMKNEADQEKKKHTRVSITYTLMFNP